jgi:hypothetical protein
MLNCDMMGRLSNTVHRQHSHSNMPAAVKTIYYITVKSSIKKSLPSALI